MPSVTGVQGDGRLTNVSILYKNPLYIADRVLPRVRVNKKTGQFVTYAKADRFTLPPSLVGPRSPANEVEWSTGLDTYAVMDNGYKKFISDDEMDNAEAPINVQAGTVDFLTDKIMLDREVRVAGIVFNTNNYAAGNQVNLANSWDTPTNDAVTHILTGIDACFLPPTIMAIGIQAFRKLQRNIPLIQAIKGTVDGQSITAEDIAKFFNLDAVLVGDARYNTAKRGQAMTVGRAWGKHAALLRVKETPTVNDVVWGSTFEWKGRRVVRWRDEDRGGDGGEFIRCIDSVAEKIIANDVGYWLQNAVS